MPFLSSDARFMGVDLAVFWRELRRPWLRMADWPVFSWLNPLPLVRLLQVDGQDSYWHGAVRRQTKPGATAARFLAVELPEHLVLRKTFSMPVMAEADVRRAVELQVRGISPFAAQDSAWGYLRRAEGVASPAIDVALASRKQIDQYRSTQIARLQNVAAPEIWVTRGRDGPIVLDGFGEAARLTTAARERRRACGLLLSACVLLLATVLTPTAQLWFRAQEASQSYRDLAERAKPRVRQREMLLQSVDQLKALSDLMGNRIEPLLVIEKLTQVLPDEASLQSLKLQGATVTISGLTDNASTLMQLLSDQPGLRDVHATAAATRISGTNKESFLVVFTLDAKAFGVVRAAESGTVADATGAAAFATTPSPSPSAPASASASAKPEVPVPSASSSSEAAKPKPSSPDARSSSPFSVGGGVPVLPPARAASGGAKP